MITWVNLNSLLGATIMEDAPYHEAIRNYMQRIAKEITQ
ncbi:MAG: hypothetical protein RL571_93 [Pseudomonadota bacterium]|jgi:hypothetical protein